PKACRPRPASFKSTAAAARPMGAHAARRADAAAVTQDGAAAATQRHGGRRRAPHACRAARRAELRAVRDAVGSAVGAALRLYEERAGELGLAVALRRGPRCPALAEALEGLHDVERHYRLLYLESSLLLQRISCDDLDTMEALPQAWECILERHKPHVVQDTLLKISLFLDNQ
uniref:Uncharacterized protein n=1 Tax=Nothoprocta perdicaria TaxID=30464 RepID=A0A8C6Z2D4_NOTPE